MNRIPYACFAVVLLAGLAVAPGARACNGAANDPVHCINNNQEITGFDTFFDRNLRPVPGLDPRTSFVLTFSEPMDTATIPDGFVIELFRGGSQAVDAEDDGGRSVWDKSAFDVSWNSDDTEATFTFREERALPTDRDSADTPDYTVNFWRDDETTGDGGRAGGPAANDFFKLTDGDFESAYRFRVVEVPPSATQGGPPIVVFDTGGGRPPAGVPAPTVTGETVANLTVLVQGEAADVRVVRTADGKYRAVDSASGHDYGSVHPDRSGLGWSFDGTPMPKPSSAPASPQQALSGAIDSFDAGTLFADGFESGNVSAWAGSTN